MFDREWAAVLVFAAGLRRHNTQLLLRLGKAVQSIRDRSVGDALHPDYLYGSYLLGRILSNSEAAEVEPRLTVLRTCLSASADSLVEIEEEATRQFGNIGELAALIGVENTFLVTVGVPWLEGQFAELAMDKNLTDEERYLATSVHANLGCDGCLELIEKLVSTTSSTRVLLVISVLLKQIDADRQFTYEDEKRHKHLRSLLKRKLRSRKDDITRLLAVKSKALEIEQKRMQRLSKRKKKRKRQ